MIYQWLFFYVYVDISLMIPIYIYKFGKMLCPKFGRLNPIKAKRNFKMEGFRATKQLHSQALRDEADEKFNQPLSRDQWPAGWWMDGEFGF